MVHALFKKQRRRGGLLGTGLAPDYGNPDLDLDLDLDLDFDFAL